MRVWNVSCWEGWGWGNTLSVSLVAAHISHDQSYHRRLCFSAKAVHSAIPDENSLRHSCHKSFSRADSMPLCGRCRIDTSKYTPPQIKLAWEEITLLLSRVRWSRENCGDAKNISAKSSYWGRGIGTEPITTSALKKSHLLSALLRETGWSYCCILFIFTEYPTQSQSKNLNGCIGP